MEKRHWVALLICVSLVLVAWLPAGAGVTAEPAVPDWTDESDLPGAWFGHAVSTAGDVNGDGYDDLIVGGFQTTSTAYQAGRVWLYYGSADGLSAAPDWTSDPPTADAYGFFGQPVGTAGDVNGDGYDDIIVGMQNYEGGPVAPHDEGAVFVWYGSENGPGAGYDWMAESEQQWAHFGLSAGTAGDVNGDGYDDIIVGAYCPQTYVFSHAFIWYGSETGLGPNGTPANADWTATSYEDYDNFGGAVATAGDVDGDGYDDVVVGACFYDHPEENEGAVFVWYGSEDGPTPDATPANADWMAESDQAGARLGGGHYPYWASGRVAGAGDVNGDGYDDLIAGAIFYDDPEISEGALFVWHGSATGLGDNGTPLNADWWAQGDQIGAYFSVEVRGAGDMDGDGYDDLLAGAYAMDVTTPLTITDAGAAYLWYGSPTGLGDPGTPANAGWFAEGDQEGGTLGMAVHTAGDVNGDGFADLVVGEPFYSDPENEEGRAHVYHGGPVDRIPPEVVGTQPADGAMGVALTAPVVITFSETILTGTLVYTAIPDPGGWSAAWSAGDTAVTLSHAELDQATTYTVTVTSADDLAGNPLAGAPVAWSFTTTVVYGVYLPILVRGD